MKAQIKYNALFRFAIRKETQLIVWLPILVLLVSLGTTYALWWDAKRNALSELRIEFDYKATEAVGQVRERMESYKRALLGLRGLYSSSRSVERHEFRTYVAAQNMANNYPGIMGVGFVQRVMASQKNQHIAALRSEGFKTYEIKPPGSREMYAPVVYIEPFTWRNQLAFGFDGYSDPVRRIAYESARDHDSAVITQRVELLQNQGQALQVGFLMVLPVYRNGPVPTSVAERREANLGWVFMVFQAKDLMQRILGKKATELDIEIFDGRNISAQTLLYDSDGTFRADGQSAALFQDKHDIVIGGRIWTLHVSSLPAFEAQLSQEKQNVIAVGGVLSSLILTFMTWVLLYSWRASIRSAQALQKELNARKQAEESLRLAAMVYESSSEGMLVTDADNRIIAVNPAFTYITGYSLADVQGRDPSYFSSGRHGPDFYHAMWDELNRTGRWQGEIWDRRKDGHIHAKYMTINTIFNEDKSVHRRIALFMDISDKKEAEEFIWRQANYDALTQLPNRSMFQQRLMQELVQAERRNTIVALLFIDLDLFKEVNDTLGHHLGDQLLIEAAKRITSSVRSSDTVARLGGDEFTVILSELHDVTNVEHVAENILQKLAIPYTLGENVVHVSGSIGITLYPRDATTPEGLLKNADQAMYVAKNMGRNRYSYFTPALQEAAQARLRLITDLRSAVEAQQFIAHYQPIVDLATGEIYKAEALVRWRHPERGLVSPGEFIPLAEETGLISQIGDWIFKDAVHVVQHLRQTYHPHFQISVNKSPKQFPEPDGIHQTWFDCLKAHDLPGDCVAIEITEGLLLNAVTDVTEKLNAFRAAGIQIAIDDFGTGYSSLSYLKRFNIDYLKIDQSFVRDIVNDPNDLALSKAIIVMAHALGLKVIAEGVETAQQLNILASAGCDYAQGYYFAKPMPVADFETLLHSEAGQHWRPQLIARRA